MRSTVAAALAAAALAGCGGGDAGDSGPCLVNYGEPVFVITSVQNANTGATVTTVTINNITLDGAPLPPGAAPPISLNIRVVGSALECTVPCGFATQPGVYRFAVSANGFSVQTVQANGSYATFSAGCPASFTGGSRIALALTPT